MTIEAPSGQYALDRHHSNITVRVLRFERGRPLRGGPAVAAVDPTAAASYVVDAPLDAKALKRLAARALFGLARTGASYGNGSGDYAIAFSTARDMRFRHGAGEPQARAPLPTDSLDSLFEAALETTEEAVLNALTRATSTTGNGRTIPALPLDRLRHLLARYGRAGSNDLTRSG